MSSPRLIFVTPWFGPGVPGGAEALTRATVERLHRAGFPVEVMTTCVRDFYGDWAQNHHEPGTVTLNGVPVHRFAVGPTDRRAFDAVNARLMRGEPISRSEERVFIHEMFHVPDLYQAIADAGNAVFVFVPYLHATTYFGAQVHPDRSYILPCLHDEAYARLGLFRELMPQVRGLIFNAESEHHLAQRLFSLPPGQQHAVVGMGVDPPPALDAAAFRSRYGISAPFVLYAGRREPGKNTPLLLRFWERYRHERATDARLVLIGPNPVAIPPHLSEDIVDLGFVPEADKWNAYAAASVVCQPSVHESFSIVVLESWLAGTPVLVHGDCAVTREHCVQADGGLYFVRYEDFAAALDLLLRQPRLAKRLGDQGRQHVQANFRWELIINRYRELFSPLLAPEAPLPQLDK